MKTTKIYNNEKEVYSGNCYVNTVIFRGRIYDEFKKVGQDGIKFSLQLSNGKERVVAPTESRTKFGENNNPSCSRFYSYEEKSLQRWRKPTFADCTAFGGIATRILNEYKPKDEIWLIAKYYSKQQDGKYYKGFIVREIITEQEIQRGTRAGNSRLKYSEKCSTNARENSNFETFDDLPF